jgi:hypothetical protein
MYIQKSHELIVATSDKNGNGVWGLGFANGINLKDILNSNVTIAFWPVCSPYYLGGCI